MTPTVEKIAGHGSKKPGGVYIETYGCQMNLADSEVVMSLLEEQGHHRASTPEDADVILVNTCIVREHAQEKRSLSVYHSSTGCWDPTLTVTCRTCWANRPVTVRS